MESEDRSGGFYIAETAVSHLIFVIATIIISVSLVAVFAGVVNDYSESIDDKSDRLSEDMLTDIEIINDPTAVPYLNENITIYVKNIGRTTIDNNTVAVLVDGEVVDITWFGTTGNVSWFTGITANITVSTPNIELDKDHTLRVIVMHGTFESITFRIRPVSDIDFQNDPSLVPYTNPSLIFYLANTGERDLDDANLRIMVDGSYRTISSFTVPGGDWNPGEIAEVQVTVPDLRQDEPHSTRAEIGDTIDEITRFFIQSRFAFDFNNDPDAVPYNNSLLTLLLENTGQETMDPTSLVILIQGSQENIQSYRIQGGGNWDHGDILELQVYVDDLVIQQIYRAQANGPQSSSDTMDFLINEPVSSFSFTNDPDQVPYSESILTFYLLNDGDLFLDIDELQIMVDGEYRTIDSFSVPDGDWGPGETAEFLAIAENIRQDITHDARAELDDIIENMIDFNTQIRYSFSITNDPGAIPYNNSLLSLFIENTASTIMNPDDLIILINGSARTVTHHEVMEGGDWDPGETLNLTVSIQGLISDVSYSLRVNGPESSFDSLDFMVDMPIKSISITNDPARIPYDNPYLTVYVRNTGELELNFTQLDLMVDGLYRTIESIAVDGGDWDPGETAVIRADVPDLRQDLDYSVRAEIHDLSTTLDPARIELRFDLNITNDPDAIPYNNSLLTVYLENTARETMDAADLAILINGTDRTIENFTVQGGGDWAWGKIVELMIKVEHLDPFVEYSLQVNGPQDSGDSIQFRIQEPDISITITNDPDLVPYSNPVLIMYIRNDGDIELDPDDLEILIDGLYRSIDGFSVPGGDWEPGEIVAVQVNISDLRQDETHSARAELDDISTVVSDFSIETRFSFDITNDPEAIPYNDSLLSIYLENTGKEIIDPDDLSALINGTLETIDSYSVMGGGEWESGKDLELTLQVNGLESGATYSLRINGPQDSEDSLVFSVDMPDMSIDFTNDPAQVPYENPVLTLYIRNTGELELDIDDLRIIVDGSYKNIDSYSVPGGDWDPDETAEFQVNVSDLRQDENHTARAELDDITATLTDFRIQTRFEFQITNDPDAVPYNDTNLTVYVKNTGRETIDPADISVLINGSLVTVEGYSVVGGGDWAQDSTLNLTVRISGLEESVEYRMKVDGPQGTTDSIEFYIEKT